MSKCWHIIRRTKFCENGDRFIFLLFPVNDLVPPAKMCLYYLVPFMSTWIIHLWPFRVTDAGMDMLSPGKSELNIIGLITQHRFMHIAPVRYIKSNFKVRIFLHVLPCNRCRIKYSGPMSFMADLYASLFGKRYGMIDELLVLAERK